MINKILIAVFSAAGVGFLWWLVAKVRTVMDQRKIYNWLRTNTRDEPGESHTNTETLAKGTCIPENRVKRACMSDKRVFRFEGTPEKWSIWRKEPQSIYEKRGIYFL